VTHPYRLGFAVKILGEGGMRTNDARRWQSGPHLSVSLGYLEHAFDYLERARIRVYRLSSATVPYGTHPDLPELDFRRQIAACEPQLAALGSRARALGLRLSTHPGQYTVLNTPRDDVAAKALLDLEQDAALFDAMGLGPEATIVIHVGGLYGDRAAALDRFCARWERLSPRARARVAVENDERAFTVDDVLELHRRLGVRVVVDNHHHRCNPGPAHRELGTALSAAYATWPAGTRPKAHLSSPRTELRVLGRGKAARPVPPLLDQHADFATPWDLAELLRAAPGPLDVMVEAKAKDLAVLWLREQTARLFPDLAAAEELARPSGRAAGRRASAATSPA
jgi:UV DNA damage endonuclease